MTTTDPADRDADVAGPTDDVVRRLQLVFRQVFGDPGLVITPQTGPDDITGWDSLGTVSLLYAIEAEFDVEIDDDEVTTLTDVGAIQRRLSAPARQG